MRSNPLNYLLMVFINKAAGFLFWIAYAGGLLYKKRVKAMPPSYYVARQGEKILAGFTKESAKLFNTPQDAIKHFRPLADNGSHNAWNICYILQENA